MLATPDSRAGRCEARKSELTGAAYGLRIAFRRTASLRSPLPRAVRALPCPDRAPHFLPYSRTQSINRSATGLSVRFLSVTIATGHTGARNEIGSAMSSNRSR